MSSHNRILADIPARRCAIVLEYWSPMLSWAAYGLARRAAGYGGLGSLRGWSFTLTDTRWFTQQRDLMDACARTSGRIEPASLIGAYRDIARGAFDCVVVTDNSEALWLLQGMQCKRPIVVADGNDSPDIALDIIKHPSVSRILKAQHPANIPLASDGVMARPLNASEAARIDPFPYFPSSASACNSRWRGRGYDTGKHAWFLGWAGTQQRTDIITAIVNAKVPFEGGLHARTDVYESKTESLQDTAKVIAPRVSKHEWVDSLERAGVVIDIPGRGAMTHRLVEAMRHGCPIVAQRRSAAHWPDGNVPRDGHELVWFTDEQDAPDACNRVLRDSALQAYIAAGARAYYEQHLTSECAADTLIRSIDKACK